MHILFGGLLPVLPLGQERVLRVVSDAMDLGNPAAGFQDNILTLIHRLFTGRIVCKIRPFSCKDKKGASRTRRRVESNPASRHRNRGRPAAPRAPPGWAARRNEICFGLLGPAGLKQPDDPQPRLNHLAGAGRHPNDPPFRSRSHPFLRCESAPRSQSRSRTLCHPRSCRSWRPGRWRPPLPSPCRRPPLSRS